MLLLKQNKFGQFLCSIEGINTKTLSIRLHELEDFGIIKRTIIKSRPVQTEYSLTYKGMALEPILAQIAVFSARYEPKAIFNDGRPRNTVKQIFRVKVCQKYIIIDDYKKSSIVFESGTHSTGRRIVTVIFIDILFRNCSWIT